MLPYFRLDPQIGFLQARNVPNPVQRTKFASDLALGITPLWTSYFGPRNKYGFVPFLGHSGLISRKLWEKTGGMPEVVSEDLAFSTKAAELGYRGHYVHDVFAQEQFPETYPQLRRQQEKYVKGGCEFIHRCLPFFLAAKDVTWFEKLDVIMSCATLFLPTLHLLFVVVFGILLAPLFGDARQLHVTIGGTSYALWKAYVLDSSFAGIWRWDFNLITALCTIAPLLGCFSVVRKQAFRLVRLIILSTVPYLSLMLVCTIGIIAYAFTGKAAFLVTADSTATSGLYASEGTNRNLLESINSSHRLMYKLELWLGAVLSILCLRTLNVTLFVFCFSVCMGPVLIRYGWDCRPLKAVMYIPFLVMFAAATQLGINLAACQGAFLPLFSFHF
jgi:cellulose synthase/poly-beta-1,6-N-acetylglucosamine synthase-like glycosyltransferase